MAQNNLNSLRPSDTIWLQILVIIGSGNDLSAGLGSIQFRNWNCSSIPIPIPELELELKLVELKMELKTGIEFFATATTALAS